MGVSKIRVLVADEGQIARRMADYLNEHGFEAKAVYNGVDAKRVMLEWQPRIVMADLMLPEINALQLSDVIKAEPKLKKSFTQLMVMSAHNSASNVKEALARGAKDYMVKPIRHEDMLKRLVFHCRMHRNLRDLNQKELQGADEASLSLYLMDLVLRQAISNLPADDILFNLTRMVSLKVDGVRCSIIHVVDQLTGTVVSSNDNRKATGIMLELSKYPEVLHVYNTGALLAIDNLDQSHELKNIKGQLKDIMFNSIIVCPIFKNQQHFGVLSVRLPPGRDQISDNEIRFTEIVAHTMTLVLSSEGFKRTGEFWQPATPISAPISLAAHRPKKSN